jgi:hypothetical protein
MLMPRRSMTEGMGVEVGSDVDVCVGGMGVSVEAGVGVNVASGSGACVGTQAKRRKRDAMKRWIRLRMSRDYKLKSPARSDTHLL